MFKRWYFLSQFLFWGWSIWHCRNLRQVLPMHGFVTSQRIHRIHHMDPSSNRRRGRWRNCKLTTKKIFYKVRDYTECCPLECLISSKCLLPFRKSEDMFGKADDRSVINQVKGASSDTGLLHRYLCIWTCMGGLYKLIAGCTDLYGDQLG